MSNVTTLRECEQLFLPFGSEMQAPTSVSPRKPKAAQAVKSAIPEELLKYSVTTKTLQEYIYLLGARTLRAHRHSYAYVIGNRILPQETSDTFVQIQSEKGRGTDFCANLAYLDTEGRIWLNKLVICLDKNPFFSWKKEMAECRGYHLGKWTCQRTSKLVAGCHFMQSEEELREILGRLHPYALKWAETNRFDLKTLAFVPFAEILAKAGFRIVENLGSYEHLSESTCCLFNRLCQNGSSPKDIFRTTKVVYTILKKEKDLDIWDCYRRLVKTGKIGTDAIQQAYDSRLDDKNLERLNSILAKKYEGKPVFTWNTLIAYLGRLDTFEAIERKEALILINDYLTMCGQLGMKPRVDGDSLKREHDIAARNIRLRRNEIVAQGMKNNCERMKKYDYSENIYFVRGIRNYDDLLDEANQQHNCVAGYGQYIAKGTSYIYVMREVANPERSLITIELSPNGKSIRQKYLAYNRPIHNKSQSEFIERWMKHIKDI